MYYAHFYSVVIMTQPCCRTRTHSTKR